MGPLVQFFRRLRAPISRPVCALLALFVLVPALTGCSSGPQMPTVLRAPYDSERVWAVVPFANESGVSAVDGNMVADRFVAEVEQVDGVRCLPLNRTLAVMQQLGMTKISDIRQLYTLMRALQVDGILIGTVTDWDPYKPLRFGAAVEVISAASDSAAQPLDLKDVTMPTTDSRVDVDGAMVAISTALVAPTRRAPSEAASTSSGSTSSSGSAPTCWCATSSSRRQHALRCRCRAVEPSRSPIRSRPPRSRLDSSLRAARKS